MPPDYVPRGEFEGYARRHQADVNAHAAFRRVDSEDEAESLGKLEDRLTALERWRWIITGAIGMLTFLVSSGLIAIVIELWRR